MTKNLIIDGQILQTNAWHRGMGKYTMQVMQELSLNAPDDVELSVLFNTALQDNSERFAVVKFLCPRIKQVFCELPTSTPKQTEARGYKAQLETYIDETFPGQDNYYLITSLFYFDFYAEFPSNCHKLMLFYDLTPLLFWRDLGGYFPPDMYMGRFAKILEAETIFSISETTRQDLIKTFGLPPEVVTNINGGFTKIADSTKKPTTFALPANFVLFPTGDLPHKNNEIAVKGFEEYCKQSKQDTPLLITSNFSQESKDRLRSFSKHIIFTDNVADEELEWLYEHASAVLFASKYEGLGMPILDAVASKKPTIASRIPVFQEMSEEAFYSFRPDSSEDLALQIKKALDQEDFSSKLKQYPAIMKKYTWANTSRAITARLEAIAVKDKKPVEHGAAQKPKLAVVCLHPGIFNQAGRYAETCYLALGEDFKIDYYFDANGCHYREMERPSFLDFIGCKVFDVSKLTLRSYNDYDGVLYIVDNAAIPSRLAQRAAVLPGIALLHNTGTKLSRQQELFKQLVIDNQASVHELAEPSYAAYRKLAELIQEDIIEQHSAPTPQEAIIRRGGLNSAIIQRLMAAYTNET